MMEKNTQLGTAHESYEKDSLFEMLEVGYGLSRACSGNDWAMVCDHTHIEPVATLHYGASTVIVMGDKPLTPDIIDGIDSAFRKKGKN